MTTWPVRATTHSSYTLSTHRGTNFHSSVPPSSTLSTSPLFSLGSMRGPRRFDPRERWGWIYFDVVRADRRIHLQAFLRLDRRGVVRASMGRVDLESSREEPMPSGEVGEVVVEGRTVRFVVDERVGDGRNRGWEEGERGRGEFAGKGVETSTYVSCEMGRASVVVGSEVGYHEYEVPEKGRRLSEMRTSRHKLDGILTKYIGAFVERDGLPWFQGHIRVRSSTRFVYPRFLLAFGSRCNHSLESRASLAVLVRTSHPLTLSLRRRGNGFDSTADTKAIFVEGGTLNYGFYDAAQGRHDQASPTSLPLKALLTSGRFTSTQLQITKAGSATSSLPTLRAFSLSDPSPRS